MHLRWLADQGLEQSAKQRIFAEYQHAVETHARVERMSSTSQHSALTERGAPVVTTLRALRGIDAISVIGLVAEIGNIGRFATVRQLIGGLVWSGLVWSGLVWSGLVPSEHSGGGTVQRCRDCHDGQPARTSPVGRLAVKLPVRTARQ